MRRLIGLTAMVATIIGIVALGPTPHLGAQGGTPTPPGHAVVGAWQITVSSPAFPPSPSLVTFTTDGTVLVADPPVTVEGPGRVAFVSAGQGSWQATGPDTAAFTFAELVAGPNGALFGSETVRGTATVATDGQSVSGAFSFTAQDPTGKVLASGAGTFQGRRIRVEPMATPASTPIVGTPAA